MKCIGVKRELSREISNYTLHAHTHEHTLWHMQQIQAEGSGVIVVTSACRMRPFEMFGCVLVEPADTSLQDNTSHISQPDIQGLY